MGGSGGRSWVLGLDIGGGLRQRTLATETAGTEHRDCLGVTPKRLGFFAGYFPAAVFFFEGDQRNHVELAGGELGPVPDGQFALGRSLFDHVCLQQVDLDVVAGEDQSCFLAELFLRARREALQIAGQIFDRGHLSSLAHAVPGVSLFERVWSHRNSLRRLAAAVGDREEQGSGKEQGSAEEGQGGGWGRWQPHGRLRGGGAGSGLVIKTGRYLYWRERPGKEAAGRRRAEELRRRCGVAVLSVEQSADTSGRSNEWPNTVQQATMLWSRSGAARKK